MAAEPFVGQLSKKNKLLKNLLFFIPPYIGSTLLFFPNIEIIFPFLMLFFIFISNKEISQKNSNIIHWFVGGILFLLLLISLDYQLTSNSIITLYFSLVLFEISNIKKSKNFKLCANSLLMLTLIHEILFCLFTNFSFRSVLILSVIITLLPNVKINLDEELIAIFAGLFLGVRALGWTLSENWKWDKPTETLDPLIHNWIIFISAPILGILVFYLMRYSIELIINSESEEHAY